MGQLAKQLSGKTNQVKMYKKGGVVHDDAAMDKKQIKAMVKPSALKKCSGGSVGTKSASSGMVKGKK